MALDYADNLDPIKALELRAGGIINARDLSELNEKLNAIIVDGQRVIAYSSGPAECITTYTDKYVFTVKWPGDAANIRLKVWTRGVDIEVYQMKVSDSTITNLDGDAGTGLTAYKQFEFVMSPSIVTIGGDYGSSTDRDVTIVIQGRKYNGDSGASGDIYGFQLYEIGASAEDGTTFQPENFGGKMMDSTRTDPNVPADTAMLQRLLLNMDKALSFRARGCCVAYPVDYAPILSSALWRAEGPYQWQAAPWANSVSVYVRTGMRSGSSEMENYSGVYDMSAFSQKQRREVRNQADIDELAGQNGGATHFMHSTNNRGSLTKMNEIPVRDGAWNDIYLLFRGTFHDAMIGPFGENCAVFKDFWEGIIETTKPASAYSGDFLDAFQDKVGRHIRLISRDEMWTDSSGDPSHVTPEDDVINNGQPLVNQNGASVYHMFDISNYKFNAGDVVGNALSPAPPFHLPSNPNDQQMDINVNKHGWTRVFSVWISDNRTELNISRFAVPDRPAPSLLVQSHLTLLNALIEHPAIVYGIRHCPAAFQNTAVSNTGNFIYNGLNVIYRRNNTPEFINPFDEDDTHLSIFAPVSLPYFVSRPPSADRNRNPTKIKFRIVFAVFLTHEAEAESDTPEDMPPRPRIVFKVRPQIETYPWTSQSSTLGYLGPWVEIDIKDKVTARKDVNTQSLWDAYVCGSKAGWDEADPSNWARSIGTYSWPPEILGEEYPWEVAEAEFDISEDIDNGLEYGVNYWVNMYYQFRSYIKLGDEPGPGTGYSGYGGDIYHIAIQSVALVPSEYPRQSE